MNCKVHYEVNQIFVWVVRIWEGSHNLTGNQYSMPIINSIKNSWNNRENAPDFKLCSYSMTEISWWSSSLEEMNEVENILISNLVHFTQKENIVILHCLSELKKSFLNSVKTSTAFLIQISTQILSSLLWLHFLAEPSWPRLCDP